ncbi:MAG: ATP-binding protein [Candidatus Omnitrophota bacterium]
MGFQKKEYLLEDNIGFFKDMLDSISLGGLLVDPKREVKYCNRNVEKIFGYNPNEVIGIKTDVLYGDRRSDPNNKSEIYQVLEDDGVHRGTAKGMTKNGSNIPLKLSTFVIKPNKGAIIFVEKIDENLGITINEGKFLQSLLDNIPDMVYFKDLQNRFILVNKAHADAVNRHPREVIGKSDLDFFPPEIAKQYYKDDNRIIKTGKPVVGKIEKALRSDGGITYVSTTKIPHFDDNGRIVGTIGITRNITKRMIAEDELREYKDRLEDMVKQRTTKLKESNNKLIKMCELQSGFTSMVSHELRTPLSVIKEGVAQTRDETLGELNVKQKKSLGIVLANIDRLIRLLNNILDLSELENDAIKLSPEPGDMNDTIKDVLEAAGPAVQKKGLKLAVNLDPGVPLLRFDRDRIIQVLYNLLNNAIKFTEQGSITVQSEKTAKNVIVTVTDTGCGIAEKYKTKIFEKFGQVVTIQNSHNRGTGLGLAICKQIIEQSGGKISVKSEPGKGSAFVFTLPLK